MTRAEGGSKFQRSISPELNDSDTSYTTVFTRAGSATAYSFKVQAVPAYQYAHVSITSMVASGEATIALDQANGAFTWSTLTLGAQVVITILVTSGAQERTYTLTCRLMGRTV